jgi:TPP-dependent pyruvate/acetoin dehydrogenase alpha subunit
MQHRDAVTVCFFGEGAMAEGEFHESLNLAALWKLPVLFCCENNLYAMGTALDRSESETDLARKAAAYEVPAWTVDGMDVEAVEDAATRAVESIRGGGGPHFLEMKTYRFRAHSMYDPELYRTKEEVAEWRERDPVVCFADRLRERGDLDDATLAGIEAEIKAEIDDAVTAAEAGTPEPVEELTRWVTSEREAS